MHLAGDPPSPCGLWRGEPPTLKLRRGERWTAFNAQWGQRCREENRRNREHPTDGASRFSAWRAEFMEHFLHNHDQGCQVILGGIPKNGMISLVVAMAEPVAGPGDLLPGYLGMLGHKAGG